MGINRPQSVEEVKEIIIGNTSCHKTKVGTSLLEKVETTLTKFLTNNNDVFAWQPEDMKEIDLNYVCHRLATNPDYRPVARRKRMLGAEKQEVVKHETSKTCKSKFIQKVKYPTWLANPLLVKKATGQWPMCVNYTDLNG